MFTFLAEASQGNYTDGVRFVLDAACDVLLLHQGAAPA